MIRAALLSFSLLIAAPALAAPDSQGHTHAEPDYIFAEAPTDHVLGSADAAHTLILYASNVCPHCGDWFADEWPRVKADLVETGKLRLVFRPMPSQPAQLSQVAFIMAECAPDDIYMDVIEDQFSRQRKILSAFTAQNGQAVKAEFDQIGKAAGLNSDAEIAACLQKPEHTKTLQTSTQRGVAAGISGIPAFIFNGTVMNGAHDAAAIQGWVEGRSSAR